MNVEKLHKIILEVNKEIEEWSLISLLNDIKTNLENIVNQPQQPNYQQELSKSLTAIRENLLECPSNHFSPTWKQILEEIGIKVFLGENLKNKLDLIIDRNQITPSIALEEISEIVTKLELFSNSTQSIIEGFDTLNIGKEDLAPGECEFGYTIPRLFIENKLSSFNKELSELYFIIGTISEIIIGKKQDFEVKSISSSDFIIFLGFSLFVADVMSKIVERIVNTYKNILEIKDLKNKLNEKGLPKQSTKEIEKYAATMMKTEINKIVKDILKLHNKVKDKGRKNELINALTISLNKIANKIDRGFNIEIRVEPLPEHDKNVKLTKVDKDKIALINKIKENSKAIEFISTSGKPILKLKETK